MDATFSDSELAQMLRDLADGIAPKPASKRGRTPRGTMPPLPKIADYWSTESNSASFPHLESRAIGWGEPFCFRCGWLAPESNDETADPWKLAKGWLERAHLHEFASGGSNAVDNLVPLCPICHYAMPHGFKDRELAIAWINKTGPGTLAPLWQQATDWVWGCDKFCDYPGFRSFTALRNDFDALVRREQAKFRTSQAA